MTAPNWLSWIENTLLVPGSPESMALTTQSTSPDVRFVRAVPQTKRVPVGWWSMPAPTESKKYPVMLVHFTCSPSPRSVYSRWPQVGDPLLHPPATPKFALAPLGRMMYPPPVRKSHVDWALAEPPASTSVPTPMREVTPSRTVTLRISHLHSRRHGRLSVGGLHRLGFPIAGARCRRRDHHVGYAEDNRVKRVDHDGAVRGNVLLVDDHDASGDVDPLIRVPGHRDGHAIDREIVDVGGSDAHVAEHRQGSRHDEVGADADSGDVQVERGKRRFGGDLVRPADGHRVKNLSCEEGRNVAGQLRRL